MIFMIFLIFWAFDQSRGGEVKAAPPIFEQIRNIMNVIAFFILFAIRNRKDYEYHYLFHSFCNQKSKRSWISLPFSIFSIFLYGFIEREQIYIYDKNIILCAPNQVLFLCVWNNLCSKHADTKMMKTMIWSLSFPTRYLPRGSSASWKRYVYICSTHSNDSNDSKHSKHSNAPYKSISLYS